MFDCSEGPQMYLRNLGHLTPDKIVECLIIATRNQVARERTDPEEQLLKQMAAKALPEMAHPEFLTYFAGKIGAV